MPKIPAFGSIGLAEYSELGLKVGLEVHQQLLTERKLFCRCPAGRYAQDYDAEILRHLRPTLSELGEYDGTALMEYKTRKEIVYRLQKDSVCTYEMDDAPPFEMNREALDIGMEISMLLGLQPVGEIHVMRKQYLDGSIPAGFQRTAILGVGGEIRLGDRAVSVTQMSIEEDSCREISDEGHRRLFQADRMGTPLVEVVTGAELRTPEEAAECCRVIRRLCRSTGRVRRGSGSGRQDVNVSVSGGTRIEIKGVGRIGLVPRLVHHEAFRQRALLEIKSILMQRGLRPDTWQSPSVEVTELFGSSDYRPLARALERGETIGAILLPGFHEILSRETQPGVHFLGELRDRVRVVACLDRRPSLVSSDQLDDSPAAAEWKRVRQVLGGTREDPLILVWGPREDMETALGEIEIRCREAMEGVPRETRQALPDGTTGFERILPGPDRMYPDTDLPAMPVSDRRWTNTEKGLPPRPWELAESLRETGLGEELVEQLLAAGRGERFLELVHEVEGVTRLAVLLTSRWRRIERDGVELPDDIDLGWYPEFQRKMPAEADELALQALAQHGETPRISDLPTGELLHRRLKQLLPDIGEPRTRDEFASHCYYVGRMKRHLNTLVSGRELAGMLRVLIDTRGEEIS